MLPCVRGRVRQSPANSSFSAPPRPGGRRTVGAATGVEGRVAGRRPPLAQGVGAAVRRAVPPERWETAAWFVDEVETIAARTGTASAKAVPVPRSSRPARPGVDAPTLPELIAGATLRYDGGCGGPRRNRSPARGP